VKAKDDLTNELKWNSYAGFLGAPTAYEIYRSIDGVWDPAPIVSLGSSAVTFIDDVQNEAYTGGNFGYFVNAVEGIGNSYGFADTSRSNTVEALQKPKLYVPTAFNPASTEPRNRTFYPVGVFVNSQDYVFIIYNRWGEKLFETTEINHGWDGTYKGSDSPQDVYTYFVKFTTSDGREFEKRGTVTLIR
jgi:gliding motility-associated-like protein